MGDLDGVGSAVGGVLDAHLHVVDVAACVEDLTGNPNVRWWEQVDSSPAAVAERVRDAGVSGGVLVQAVGAHGFDNSLVVEAARMLGDDWRAMVAVGQSTDDPISLLDRASAHGATGLRLFSIPDPWLHDDVAVELVHRCRDLEVGPNVCCLPEELQAVARLAAAVPDCEIAVDHCGFVAVGGDDQALADLAQYENLVVKTSTGVFDAAAVAPRSVISRLLDLFGANRIVWGSDHPQVHDRAYADLVALAVDAISDLDATTQEAILSRTASRLWFDHLAVSGDGAPGSNLNE